MSWVPLPGQSYSANPYDLRSTRRKKLRPVSLPVRYLMHTRPMRPRPAPRSIPPSGSAMDLPGNPRPDPPHLRRGGRRDRETDRHTHTHTHTQREREREKERDRERPIPGQFGLPLQSTATLGTDIDRLPWRSPSSPAGSTSTVISVALPSGETAPRTRREKRTIVPFVFWGTATASSTSIVAPARASFAAGGRSSCHCAGLSSAPLRLKSEALRSSASSATCAAVH